VLCCVEVCVSVVLFCVLVLVVLGGMYVYPFCHVAAWPRLDVDCVPACAYVVSLRMCECMCVCLLCTVHCEPM
jgi:hypothetical protein